ncbi:MAG: hypothetical protein Q8L48_07815 [Archangium sp.]|nr:hypothetical protein [Archangium sp.]
MLLSLSASAAGTLPSADALLQTVGYSPEEIATIKTGQIVRRETRGAGDRDLNLGYAFFVKATPAALNKELSDGVLQVIDPNSIATGVLTGASSVGAFSRLHLKPNTDARVKQYVSARPGTDLNLSSAEIGEFNDLAHFATRAVVEKHLRAALLDRYQAYKTKGLDGIADYERADGELRSPQDELTGVMDGLALQDFAPKAWASMLHYPASRVPGTREVYRWEHFKVDGVPTIALTHGMSVPNGDAFLVMQRQFYVSEGFNCEQAIVALLPVEGGTMVIFSNHTSTDKVEGFPSGIKRSIGRGIVAKQLEKLFGKLQRRNRATK